MARDRFGGVSEQSKASRHRLEDARTLSASSRWRGAMYLAGYAVECLLKTKLMRMYGCRHLRDLEELLQERRILSEDATIFTHRLEVLLGMAWAFDRLRASREIWRSYLIVNQWIPAWRYSADLSSHDDAHEFLAGVDRMMHWIDVNL